MWDNPWLALLWVVICVALIVALAYWFTKYVAARGFPGALGAQGSEGLRVLARLGLGKDGTLVLVQAGERYFLLGVTPAGITNLAELTGEEAARWTAAQGGRPAPPSFLEAMRTVIQQKKQR